MMKKIVAIGWGEKERILDDGKEFPYETEIMDREIIRLTGKEKPNFLFMVHAQDSLESQEEYFQTMKRIYGKKFGCQCLDLKSNELDNMEKVKEKIDWADIIYEGGGDTEIMLELWRNSGFDELLYNAWNAGKVISGISAGAVCWFKSCDSERDNGKPTNVECLNWFNAHLTPHCEEHGRYETTKENLKKNKLVGIILSDCAALEIIDNQYRMLVSEPLCHNIKQAYGKKVYWINDAEYKEEIILPSKEFKNIDILLSKRKERKHEDER